MLLTVAATTLCALHYLACSVSTCLSSLAAGGQRKVALPVSGEHFHLLLGCACVGLLYVTNALVSL